MKFNISKDWSMEKAELEEGCESVEAGAPPSAPNEAEKESSFGFPGLGDLVWASWLESVSPKAREEIRAAVDKTQKHIARLTSKLAEMELEISSKPRVEQCIECLGFVSEWVEADHRNGRICRPCERVLSLRQELEKMRGEG